MRALAIAAAVVLAAGCAHDQAARQRGDRPTPKVSEILESSPASDWRRLDPASTLYMEIPSGRVVIELAPEFAPRHVANIRTLVRQGYFDGLAIVRSQDNFVVQWGDPEEKRDFGAAQKSLAPEFTRPAAGLAFDPLPDRDTYAPEAGFAAGFPAARDPAAGSAWMVHCYGVVGAGRGNEDDSGNGAELYAIIGSAPRLLDRNITVVGRVVQGIEKLSVLPRGTGALGFYEKPEQRTPIRTVRMAADVAASERTELEVLRTDGPTFGRLIEARRWRRDDWYKVPAGHVDVCSMPIPIRNAKPRESR